MKVRDVMTRPAFTCGADTTLDEASRLMEQSGCGTVAVLDSGDRIAGILTDRDIALAIGQSGEHPANISVDQVMAQPVYSCRSNEPISDVLERMADVRVRRMPVVSAAGKVEGVLSIDDIVLWAVPDGGVTRKALIRALQAICAAHHPMFDTESVVEHPVPVLPVD